MKQDAGEESELQEAEIAPERATDEQGEVTAIRDWSLLDGMPRAKAGEKQPTSKEACTAWY